MKNILKNAGYLFLRFFIVCILVFATIPLIAVSPGVLGPVMGVFYLVAIGYLWGFTSNVEGRKDRNRVSIGQAREFPLKGVVCGLLASLPLILFNLVPLLFPDPIDSEYRQAYLTDTVTPVAEDARFNKELRRVSGQNGTVTEVWFDGDGDLKGLIYRTTDGLYVKCDSTMEEDQIYSVSENAMSLSSRDETAVFASSNDLTDAQTDAFTQCRGALSKVKQVLGTVPVIQQVFLFIKQALAMGLIYFCNIFTGGAAVWNSVVYCLSLLLLSAVSGVGYFMGYRGMEPVMPWGKGKK